MNPQIPSVTGCTPPRSSDSFVQVLRRGLLVVGFGVLLGGMWLVPGCAPSTAETSSSDTLFDRAKNNPMEYMPNLDAHDIDGESKLGRDADHVFNPDQPFGR
jgi:hypothetical protein